MTVTGNLIGTNAAGTGLIGGTQFGVRASFTPGVTIGGTTPVSRNVISLGGSNAAAIQLYNEAPSNNEAGPIIEGNFLGTDVTGTIPLGNGIGVELQGPTVAGCTIVSNVIGAGTVGVKDGGQGTVVQGNFIGTDASATKDLGNSEGAIWVMGFTTTIGGAADGQSNVIAHNGRRGSESPVGGVQVDEDGRATIGRNQFFDNYPLGIDLLDSSGNPGISPDDACDADSGGNLLQNFPIITQVIPGASTTTSRSTSIARRPPALRSTCTPRHARGELRIRSRGRPTWEPIPCRPTHPAWERFSPMCRWCCSRASG